MVQRFVCDDKYRFHIGSRNFSAVLCSPFYGERRPRQQQGSKLLCVSDLLLLGKTTIEEARALLHWLKEEIGFNKLGVCGLSMGERDCLGSY